ncbi:MAG: F0F1 ATP synthase subunit A [Pseudobdellovibrionaceae bacterium]|jgi:F-type H+-transporting ATPase subunit a
MAFSWTSLIPGVGHEFAHVATAGIVTAGLIGAGLAARSALGTGEKAIVPAGKFSVRGLTELATEFIYNLASSIIGPAGKHYVPLFAAVFVWTYVNNLVGFIPGMAPATEIMSTSFAMGIFIFLAYNFIGLKVNGVAYLKHFVGPVWWLFMLMIPLEIISHMVRPFSLGLRLANVLMGDHKVVSVFTDLVPLLVPLPFLMLGLIVTFVQAFVFTLLSMVYVSLAQAHDH